MAKRGKRLTKAAELYDRSRLYPLNEAVETLKALPAAKFDETVDIAFRLGIDPRQGDQTVRGAVSLPHGTGKEVRVVVIAEGDAAAAAESAGADFVGYEDLLERIQGGWLDFDMMIATPQTMQKVRRLGRVLGPRGLMPNPRTGTVTDDAASAVQEAKKGRVEYRADRTGCVHVPVGKVSFAVEALVANAETVMNEVRRAKPEAVKGQYLLSCTLSSTMGPGIKLSVSGGDA